MRPIPNLGPGREPCLAPDPEVILCFWLQDLTFFFAVAEKTDESVTALQN